MLRLPDDTASLLAYASDMCASGEIVPQVTLDSYAAFVLQCASSAGCANPTSADCIRLLEARADPVQSYL